MKHEYKTVETMTLEGLQQAETLYRNGWKMIHTGLFSVLFEKKAVRKPQPPVRKPAKTVKRPSPKRQSPYGRYQKGSNPSNDDASRGGGHTYDGARG